MKTFDLELKKLRKVYPGNTLAVEGFDLQVERGEFISFVGPSGCGKTTTLRMIAGLESITSGDLLIRGENFTSVPTEQRPTSTIFQNYAIFPHMSVRENIEFGLHVRKITGNTLVKKVDLIIEKLELGDIQHSKENALSGGQKQRLALARGLVTEPDILLLDEPLGALDANLRKSIQEELKQLQRSLNITFVFVTHAQSEALSMGDRVVVMNAGKVEQISEPYDLYTRPKTSFVAKFIGRNILIKGKIAGSHGELVTVKTAHGNLSGVPSFDVAIVKSGTDIQVVVPSELVSMKKPGSKIKSGEHGITGKVKGLNRVGRVIHTILEISDGNDLQIETYAENIASLNLVPGSLVDLVWEAEKATIVWDGENSQ
ncbi:MAG: ABC transporter ATP-binding protein [Rhizobiales bacterium]|nr:ABC transporter ATP-binding protein [Hyphomicrobiales bacterium]